MNSCWRHLGILLVLGSFATLSFSQERCGRVKSDGGVIELNAILDCIERKAEGRAAQIATGGPLCQENSLIRIIVRDVKPTGEGGISFHVALENKSKRRIAFVTDNGGGRTCGASAQDDAGNDYSNGFVGACDVPFASGGLDDENFRRTILLEGISIVPNAVSSANYRFWNSKGKNAKPANNYSLSGSIVMVIESGDSSKPPDLQKLNFSCTDVKGTASKQP